MNKARRHELKMLHYRRRLRNLRLVGKEGKFYAFRSHGKPCSCGICSYEKYNRAKAKNIEFIEISQCFYNLNVLLRIRVIPNHLQSPAIDQ